MALEGDRPIGHTSVQFMIVRQRTSRKGSLFKSSRRSRVARSRLSPMKRYAWISPAGPTNRSWFHHDEGHWLAQQPHMMHSYEPSSLSRSAHRLPQLANPGNAHQSVSTIDIDRVGAAYALVAGFSDRERIVLRIPDAQNDVQQHPVGRRNVDMEILHVVPLSVVAEN